MSTPTREQLATLFVGVFTFLREKLRGSVSMDEVSRIALSVLDGLRVEEGPVSWETAEPTAIRNARWIDRVGLSVRIVGQITHIDDTRQGTVEHPSGEVELVETTVIKMCDREGDTLDVLPAVGRTLIEKLQEGRRAGTLVELLGMIVVVPMTPTVGRFFLHVVDARPSTTALDLLGATATERSAARELLGALRRRRETPLAYLLGQLATNLSIVAVDDSPHLGEGLEFAVLQGTSCGFVGNAPARLHGLIVGPPGQGKKLYGLATRAVNPISCEGSAVKMSPAGLIGASHRTADGWRSMPGLLPLASQGVCVVQDAHAWSAHRVAQIGPILMELIEDGEVRDSVAGGQKRRAETALMIDLNRRAQTAVGGAVEGPEAAILGLLPLLSRIDTIIEIPVSPESAWDVGEQMVRSLRQGGGSFEQQAWVRSARLLVALLRDEHCEIDVSRVEEELAGTHREFREQCRKLMADSPVAACAIPVRLSINLVRFVLASARANDRGYATSEDVARAARFASKKIDFLRGVRASVSGCPGGRRAADEAFWAKRAGQEVSPGETARAYQEETGETASVRTIQRELQRRGAINVAHGRWLLPPAKGSAS